MTQKRNYKIHHFQALVFNGHLTAQELDKIKRTIKQGLKSGNKMLICNIPSFGKETTVKKIPINSPKRARFLKYAQPKDLFGDWAWSQHKMTDKFKKHFKVKLYNSQEDIAPQTMDGEALFGNDTAVNSSRPPLGIMPSWLYDEQRCKEIEAAMLRYMQAGIEPPKEWAMEWHTRSRSVTKNMMEDANPLVRDQILRHRYPANVEGSKEFNEACEEDRRITGTGC